MIDWFFLLIPVVVAILLVVFWTKSVVWWEIALLLFPTSLLILLLNTIMVSYSTSDTEYLGSYIVRVNYYEPWNERVSCTHPIYCSSGSGKTRTTYVCGHQHAYDVDFHPEHWEKENNLGEEFSISSDFYNLLKKRFSTKRYFTELNRDYHTLDGDMYSVDWAGQPERSSTITEEASYTNKIKASHSVFKFETITEKEKRRWKLYDYPKVDGDRQPVVLGRKLDGLTNRKLQYLNGYYGARKQFRMFILFFKNQPIEVAQKQRSYWEGGNKNELIVCVGVDDSGKYQWCDAFSWMDKPTLEVEVEDYFNTNRTVNLSKFADWMPEQIEEKWKRKNFEDFKYLQIELTPTQIWWVMIIVFIYNVGISIWVIRNEHENIMSDQKSSLANKFVTWIKAAWYFIRTLKNKK